MNHTQTTILLVEDNPADAKMIQEALAGSGDHQFRVEWVTCLSDALERLGREGIEVVLLAMTLPDGSGIEAYDRIFLAAPNALILMLSDTGNEETAQMAVQHGAHDYFVKEHIDPHWLPRALRYDIERKLVQDALLNSEARFRAMSDASPLGIFVSDAEGGCIYTNVAYQKISGLSFEQALGTNWTMAIHPDDRQRVLAEWRATVGGQEAFQSEFRFLREDGGVVWTRINSAAICNGGKPTGRVKTVEDITERKLADAVLQAAEEALFEEKERAQVTLNSIGDAVLTTDILGNVTYMNVVAEKMTGWSCDEALGRTFSDVFKIVDGTTRKTAENPMLRAIESDTSVGLASNSVLLRRDGSESAIEDSAAPIHDRDGHATGAVLVFHDASESRAIALKMTHLAQHDFLTGLPNRMLLTERLSQAIGQSHRHHKKTSLLFTDLDYFKEINDTLGHTIGDQMLQSVAERLVTCVRATDTVCRQGGDEFVILLAEIEQPQDAAIIAEKLLDAFAAPHLIGGHELHVTLSIGISVYPDDGVDVDSVMQNADTAMYHAKAKGRNNYQFFKTGMDNHGDRRLFANAEYPSPQNNLDPEKNQLDTEKRGRH